jgi:hypothetical protein
LYEKKVAGEEFRKKVENDRKEKIRIVRVKYFRLLSLSRNPYNLRLMIRIISELEELLSKSLSYLTEEDELRRGIIYLISDLE